MASLHHFEAPETAGVAGCLRSIGWTGSHRADCEAPAGLDSTGLGLPNLNGIEVVRRIRDLAPKSKVLIVSQYPFADVVQEAFSLGVCGYIDKSDAGSELLPAVEAVIQGKKFVSSRLAGSR